MGMSLDRLLYLQAKGALPAGEARLLDIGPQNVYGISPEQIRSFVKTQGQVVSDEQLDREVERLVYFSTPRPEERTTLLSEITDLTPLEYNSYDICPGLKTDILDLNFDDTPPHHRRRYDVVLNFGTTEHVFNQWNSFKIMHETAKVGGHIYFQLPASGYLDHGYYCYTPLFFKDMADANQYEIVDLFLTDAGTNDLKAMKIDIRDSDRYMEPNSASLPKARATLTCFNIHVLVRKTADTPFRCGAEIATAHSPIDARIKANYEKGADQNDPLGKLQNEIGTLRHEASIMLREASDLRDDNARLLSESERLLSEKAAVDEELARLSRLLDATLNSTSWKITRPMRGAVQAVRGKKD